MSVELDYAAFHRRARTLWTAFKNPGTRAQDFGNADALLFVVGAADDDVSYAKTTALQTWLLGYEFPDTILAITDSAFVFLASAKKGTILEGLCKGEKQVPIEILKRSKDETHNADMFTKLFGFLSASYQGKSMGSVLKDKYGGKFIQEFKAALEKLGKGFENVDVSIGLGQALAYKDDEEVKIVKQACKITSTVMNNYFVEEMQNIIDNDIKISHDKFSAKVENRLIDEKERKKLKLPSDLVLDLADWCYPPIIQSGGKYDLKPSAMSNSEKLHDGTILCSIGARYKSYCSSVGRTYLVNPEKEKEENYKFLTELQDHVLGLLKPGVPCNDLYAKVLSYIDKKRPELKDHFVKNCGFSMGLEFRESLFVLGPKCARPLKAGMIINLSLGFSNLEIKGESDPQKKTYALLLIDTVLLGYDGAMVLTQSDKDLADVSYAMGDDEEEPESNQENKVKSEKKKKEGSSSAARASGQVVGSRRTAIIESRRRDDTDKASEEEKRRNHQKLLATKKQEEGILRFAEGKGTEKAVERAVFRKFESYRKDIQLPRAVVDLKIVVDRKAETVILPIYGQPVPFHISTLKNVTKSDEQEYTLLRFNFITPGQIIGKKDLTGFENPNATFIRALSFKSSEVFRMNEICREINDLKKELQKREAERAEMADLVEQDSLIEIKGRRPLRLPEVFVRPAMEGKRRPGDLEIHTNGLRFSSQLKGDSKIDILFSNIKHLFFQPCDGELLVLLHVHLKNPIMIGKKKTKDVQFYREVSDASFDETGNRRRRINYGDEDELAAEQEERRRRGLLNKEFQAFSEKIGEMSKNKCDVDVPFRELGFKGVPHRQLTLLQPTTDCLVQLTELPFLVITLADVEIAHLERVQFGLKNFDLVFVFKDFKRPVVHINTIPISQLENVKEWLDSVDICFSEGPVNLSWPQIMKTVNEDPAAFFQEGGWSFLNTEADDESDVSESASEFEMSGSEAEGSAASSEESDDESAFTETDSDDMSGSGSEEEESEGEDWDELEKKAARADAKRGTAEMSDDDRRKKKRR